MTASAAASPRRDAARTRKQLLDTATRLFARSGYANTSVREIADAAGANMSLVNRYFESKEGLFAACLGRLPRGQEILLDSPEHLLLLAHDPGTERAQQARLEALRAYGDKDRSGGDTSIPPAQLMLAAAIGITLLRLSGLQPLGSARESLPELLHELAGFLMCQRATIR